MNIRPYHINDKAAVLHLLRMNTPQYFAPEEEAHFIKYLNDDVEDYFILEDEGITVGCGGINYFPLKHLARISWDIVHPDYQGMGVGSQLTQFRISEIKKNAAMKTIRVRTSQVAYKFYEKMGFELEKIVEDFWSKGFHLYQMNMDILP